MRWKPSSLHQAQKPYSSVGREDLKHNENFTIECKGCILLVKNMLQIYMTDSEKFLRMISSNYFF